MHKIFLAIVAITMSSQCCSQTAHCSIEITDGSTGTKYTVEHNIEYYVGTINTKQFKLPGSAYNCVLYFFGFSSGTFLSCRLDDEIGHHFVTSDRSDIDEKLAKNNLSFRYKSSFYVLKSSCK